MSQISKVLYALIGLLTIDALLELAFVSSTVSFLHNRAGRSFLVQGSGRALTPYHLHGKPEHLLLDEGHTSNGAAGTAIVLVGLGGLLTFLLLHADARHGYGRHRPGKLAAIAHHAWMAVSLLSFLLTTAALGYTMSAVNAHRGQNISPTVASSLNDAGNPAPYPFDSWTPENWFAAVLALPLADAADRALLRTKYDVIKGWRWNLVPMFLLGLAVLVVGVLDALERRRVMRQSRRVGSKGFDDDMAAAAAAAEDEPKAKTPMLDQTERVQLQQPRRSFQDEQRDRLVSSQPH